MYTPQPSSSPLEHAGLFSKTYFTWVNGLVSTSRTKNNAAEELEQHDVPALPTVDRPEFVSREFQVLLRKSRELHPDDKDGEATVRWALFKVSQTYMIQGFLLYGAGVATKVVMPLLISAILSNLEHLGDADRSTEDKHDSLVRGILFAVVFGLAIHLQTLVGAIRLFVKSRLQYQWRSAATSAVYLKCLQLNAASFQGTTTGEVMNLMQIDVDRIEWLFMAIVDFFFGILEVLISLGILYSFVGPYMFVGLAVLLSASPLSSWVGEKYGGYIGESAEHADKRISATNECLQGMKSVKMNAWEDLFQTSIIQLRSNELGLLRKSSFLASALIAVFFMIPSMGATATITLFLWFGDSSSASVLFSAISVFSTLEEPMKRIPNAVICYKDYQLGIKRIGAFLMLDEVNADDKAVQSFLQEASANTRQVVPTTSEEDDAKDKQPCDGVAVEMTNVTCYWGGPARTPEEKPVLQDITCSIPTGKLTAVMGAVGSGKSSLCNTILGELVPASGTVKITKRANNTFAYASQTAWLANATLRDNILFGEPFDDARYREVIKVCQLTHDLELLPNGDMTMIGEKGINLSGGQKQRVNVARAAYSKNEIVILDDPLSALDPGVANKLFTECICRFMQGRTRVLVTNQLNVLKSCDWVVLMETTRAEATQEATEAQGDDEAEDDHGIGKIVVQGAFQDVKSAPIMDRMLNAFAESAAGQAQEHENRDGETSTSKDLLVEGEGSGVVDSAPADVGDDLMEEEERQMGAITGEQYWSYIRHGGGLCGVMFVLALVSVGQVLMVLNMTWVSYWNDALQAGFNTTNAPFTEIEDLLHVDQEWVTPENGNAVYAAGYTLTLIVAAIARYSASMFMLAVVGLKAARSLHTEMLDSVLHAPMQFFDTTPIGRILNRFSKDISSIDRISLDWYLLLDNVVALIAALITVSLVSPVFLVLMVLFVPLFYFLSSVYRPCDREINRMEDISRSPLYAHFGETLAGLETIRAYGAQGRFERASLGFMDVNLRNIYFGGVLANWLTVRMGIIGSGIALAAALLPVVVGYVSVVNVGLAGVSLNFSLNLYDILHSIVVIYSSVEVKMNSVQRVSHYSNAIKQERPHTSNNPPSDSWPPSGQIQVQDLSMRYRDDTPLVLKNVSFTVNGGEKVGVVGRTGCGKSSLLLCLMRLVEPEVASGKPGPITIDGVDTVSIGLKELRSKISIVPQDPVLFQGTIRSNLDPQGVFGDAKLWISLKQCNLDEFVSASPDTLDMEVTEYGANLSQGQRQLVSLARSLLNRSKIVLMDEATSSIDFETDQAIQRTIREAFADCTIITIAHRINTIIDNDKILVLDAGKVGEYGAPKELMAKPGSMLKKMVDESNKAHKNV